eukprot:TRINITY_DN28336_c0_g1_i1.p1 TRINITY_DN28336_c0_g1~~TRINITY_DN28336_c0_g1_i1.p1  ORF type:complete len:259 (-),score=67.59 TRINITY_DN28336_c0_g1_i1:635-1411(-)
MQGALADYQSKFHTGKVLGNYILNKLAARPGMRVLDFGCGDGLLTAQIAETGAEVVGIDKDPSFVAAAAARGLDARVQDGHALPFREEFDAVFSNATLHWLPKRHGDVVQGIFQALRPGGKFVAELGAHRNVETIVNALSKELDSRGHDAKERNPWFFPTPAQYEELLQQAGFHVQLCETVEAPTLLEEDVDVADWLRTFTQKWLQGLPAEECQEILGNVRHSLLDQHVYKNGRWELDYWRLRVVSQRPPISLHEAAE